VERAELARRLWQTIPDAAGAAPAFDAPGGVLIVEERDPARFMAAFARAVSSPGLVFLADPAWGPAERSDLAALTALAPEGGEGGAGWLMVPSGGTGGRLKFARHDGATIEAAVRGFCTHFQAPAVNSVGLLPLHHVSGLMAWMRSALSGGTCLPWEWKRIESGDYPARPPGRCFISLVPTQLQRLLGRPEAAGWLAGFDTVFVGGGPVWPELANAAARAGIPVSLGYGMTETAAMVTALHPREFQAGNRSSGAAMPHAEIKITGDGLVQIFGESVFRGYYPDFSSQRSLITADLGSLDSSGHLHISGRKDSVIITGGKKVDPQEVEAALMASGEFSDVAVLGVPDPEWGEAVVACYPAAGDPPDADRITSQLSSLASFKRPRRFIPIRDWPRNDQWKLNRAALLAIVRA